MWLLKFQARADGSIWVFPKMLLLGGDQVAWWLEVLGWLQQRRDSGLTGCLSWRVSYKIALRVSLPVSEI